MAACARVTNSYALFAPYASSATAADLAGSRTATVHGTGTYSASGGPVSGSGSLVFDGSTYVQLPAMTFGAPLSVVLWAQAAAANLGGWTRYFDFGSGGPGDNLIAAPYAGAEDTVGLMVANGAAANNIVETGVSVSVGVWTHVVVTLDAGGRIALYTNGALGFTAATGVSFQTVQRSGMYFGRSNPVYWSDTYFVGAMAYLQLALGTAFGPGDVANLYADAGCTPVAPSLAAPSPDTVSAPGALPAQCFGPAGSAVGCYDASVFSASGSAFTWTDLSASGNHLTLHVLSQFNAILNGVVNFNGGVGTFGFSPLNGSAPSGLYVHNAYAGSLAGSSTYTPVIGTGDFTYAAWLWTWLGAEMSLFSTGRASSQAANTGRVTTTGVFDSTAWSTTDFTPNDAPNLVGGGGQGGWVHFVATRSGQSAAVYVNGAQVATQSSAHLNNWVGSALALFTDTTYGGSASNIDYHGWVGNVALLTSALTEDEVHSLFVQGSAFFDPSSSLPPLPASPALSACALATHAWNLDPAYAAGAQLRDTVGAASATVFGNAAFGGGSGGPVAGADYLIFDGSSTWVALPSLTFAPPLSVALWFQTSTLGMPAWARLWDFCSVQDVNGNHNPYDMFMAAPVGAGHGFTVTTLPSDGGNIFVDYNVYTGYTVTPGAWTHVVLTVDSSGNLAFFANGVSVFTASGLPAWQRSSFRAVPRPYAYLGMSNYVTDITTYWYYFKGSMASFQMMFGTVLSGTAVSSLYANTGCSAPAGLRHLLQQPPPPPRRRRRSLLAPATCVALSLQNGTAAGGAALTPAGGSFALSAGAYAVVATLQTVGGASAAAPALLPFEVVPPYPAGLGQGNLPSQCFQPGAAVACYDANSYSGATWTDVSGNGNDLTLSVTVPGGSWGFSATAAGAPSGLYVHGAQAFRAAYAPAIGTGDFTYAAWVRRLPRCTRCARCAVVLLCR